MKLPVFYVFFIFSLFTYSAKSQRSNTAYRSDYFPVNLFHEVDTPPSFFTSKPYKSSKRAKKKFNRRISRFIHKKIDRNMLRDMGSFPAEEHMVNVTIRIKTEGILTHVIAEGFHSALEQEVNRVLWDLPLVVPAQNHGIPVNVAYNTFVKFTFIFVL